MGRHLDLEPADAYLAEGTAIALQLGHRESRDLDWFCASPVDVAATDEVEPPDQAAVESARPGVMNRTSAELMRSHATVPSSMIVLLGRSTGPGNDARCVFRHGFAPR